MSKLSNKAFAIMAVCEKTKEHFGITVDPRNGCYAFTWAFKIKKEQAKKEGYEQANVTGKVMYDKDFNGCPYCGSKKFYICNRCGKVVCYHDQEVVTCPNCGSSSSLQAAENVNLSGSDF